MQIFCLHQSTLDRSRDARFSRRFRTIKNRRCVAIRNFYRWWGIKRFIYHWQRSFTISQEVKKWHVFPLPIACCRQDMEREVRDNFSLSRFSVWKSAWPHFFLLHLPLIPCNTICWSSQQLFYVEHHFFSLLPRYMNLFPEPRSQISNLWGAHDESVLKTFDMQIVLWQSKKLMPWWGYSQDCWW